MIHYNIFATSKEVFLFQDLRFLLRLILEPLGEMGAPFLLFHSLEAFSSMLYRAKSLSFRLAGSLTAMVWVTKAYLGTWKKNSFALPFS